MWVELADTLIGLVESVQPPRDAGLVVTEAEIDIPLEVRPLMEGGTLKFFGTPPQTRWKTGFMSQAHLGKLRIVLEGE